MPVTSMGTLGMVGFLALLALAAAALLLWLVTRLNGRVISLERQARDLASACRILHQKIDSIQVSSSGSAAGKLLELGPGPEAVPTPLWGA